MAPTAVPEVASLLVLQPLTVKPLLVILGALTVQLAPLLYLVQVKLALPTEVAPFVLKVAFKVCL